MSDDAFVTIEAMLEFTGPHSLLLGVGKRHAWFRKKSIIDHGDGRYTVPAVLAKAKGLLCDA